MNDREEAERYAEREDVVCLVRFAGAMLETHGSIGAFFADGYVPGDMASSLERFRARALALDHGGAYRTRRLPRSWIPTGLPFSAQ